MIAPPTGRIDSRTKAVVVVEENLAAGGVHRLSYESPTLPTEGEAARRTHDLAVPGTADKSRGDRAALRPLRGDPAGGGLYADCSNQIAKQLADGAGHTFPPEAERRTCTAEESMSTWLEDRRRSPGHGEIDPDALGGPAA